MNIVDDERSIMIPVDISQYFYFGKNSQVHSHISSNSWGSDPSGEYTDRCRDTDKYLYENGDDDFTVFLAGGNEGNVASSRVSVPASAKNVVAGEYKNS